MASDTENLSDDTEDLPAEEKFLAFSRNGQTSQIKDFLVSRDDTSLLVNCKGTSKANRDWSPLHLSSYFGHTSTAELLIEKGADVNATNDKGDTPLHKAAYTGRLDVVTLLLKNGADINIVNIEGHKAMALCKNPDIKDLIQAAHVTENSKTERKFLTHASEGDIEGLEQTIKDCRKLNINCVDSLGNSALHLAAYRDRQQVAAFLMQAGIKSDIKNKNGQIASDVATSQAMKQVLDVAPLNHLSKTVSRFEGELYKQTRLFGFKLRYVVLDKGVLSIFNTRADASSGARRRTYKYLDDAQCLVYSKDNLRFAILYNDEVTHRFKVAPTASDPLETISRQKWMNAISSHIEYSTYYMHKGLNTEDSDSYEELLPLSSMADALQTAQAHQSAVEKDVNQLMLLAGKLFNTSPSKQDYEDTVSRCTNIASSSRDMCNVLQHCLTIFTQQEQLRNQQLAEERERCRVLQESLRVLAVQHHELEQHIETGGGYSSPIDMGDSSLENSDDEFYDCDVTDSASMDGNGSNYSESSSPNNNTIGTESVRVTDLEKVKAIQKSRWDGRTSLPVPMLSRNDFSVWSILKQCIGKELSKITMPVIFNEPLSFLQRVTEYMEYAYLLDRANLCETPEERMAYISAFAISACASNWDRLGKPFNPLLGETYELDRPELGYKVVCEQVSHHPPISAFHVSAQNYSVYGAINPKLKFWGKSVEVTPKGVITVNLLRHGESYTWENVNCSVHNIIVGKLWVEHHGRMEIVNHKTGHRADISFKKSNMFSKEVHKIEGCIVDSRNVKLLMLYGSWTDAIFSVLPQQWELHVKPDKQKSGPNLDVMKSFRKSLVKSKDDDQEIPKRASDFDLKIPGQTFLWQADDRSPNSDKYYSFTKFAMMLNELNSDASQLCPTDCRLRPDIRCLELGNIDEAAEKKVYLEEKQRGARKEMKKNKEEWSPKWFSLDIHPVTKKSDWLFNHRYLKRDWAASPDIF